MILSALCIFLASCTNSRLAVYSDYLNRESLASYHVGTPDPFLNYPPIGQRLIVVWTLKKGCLRFSDLHLKATIRFRNNQETIVEYPVIKSEGTFIYSLLNDDYIKTGGMLTYQVQLIGDDCVLDEWRHQMWANLIRIGEGPENAPQEDQQSCEQPISQQIPEIDDEDEFCKSAPY